MKITPRVFPNNPGLLNNKGAINDGPERLIEKKKLFFVILLPRCHGSFGMPLQKGVPERGSNVAAWQQMAKIARSMP